MPRATTRGTETTTDKVTAATSSTSLYDNVGAGPNQNQPSTGTQPPFQNSLTNGGNNNVSQTTTKTAQREGSQINRQTRDRSTQQETSTMTSDTSVTPKTSTASVGTQNVGSQLTQTETTTSSTIRTQQNQQNSSSNSTVDPLSKSEATQAGGGSLHHQPSSQSAQSTPGTGASGVKMGRNKEHMHHHILTNTKSMDYTDVDMVREAELRAAHHR